MNSLFKEPKQVNYRVTLDTIHQRKVQEFQNNTHKIPKFKKELYKLEKKYNKFEKIKNCDLDDEQLELKFELKDKIEKITKILKSLENKSQIKNYYNKVGNLLFKYYDEKNDHEKKGVKKNSSNNKSVVDFFIPIEKKENDTKPLKENNYMSKNEIINKYFHHTDTNYIRDIDYENIDYDRCEKCNLSMRIIQSEGNLICPNCGLQKFILINSDKPSYKDPPREMSYFAYKRINHFNEWLAQFQAKESTDIPKEVFDKILIEIKKERITNMASLTLNKLRGILKKLKFNKYYEHVPHIINRLNGIPAPVMTRHTEEKLRMMFKEIQGPFMKHCPKNRKNFLSYSYVLHKFVQLLGMDEFTVCFPLLKSREKLHQQDIIWQKICQELKWEFIKSL